MIEIHFPGRKQSLMNVVRYHRFTPMFYRSNLWQHSQRLAWMIEELAPLIRTVYPQFQVEVAGLIAQVHDDLEIVMGDIMLGEKLKYNAEQKADLDAKERAAINEVVKMFPQKIGEHNYAQLMLRYQNLDANDVEAVVVKYCDKFDAFGEALHEVHAGNVAFCYPYQEGLMAPIASYLNILQKFADDYPVFKKIRATGNSFLMAPQNIDPFSLTAEATLPTLESLNTHSEYIPYQIWKQNVLKYGGDEGRGWLSTKVE